MSYEFSVIVSYTTLSMNGQVRDSVCVCVQEFTLNGGRRREEGGQARKHEKMTPSCGGLSPGLLFFTLTFLCLKAGE